MIRWCQLDQEQNPTDLNYQNRTITAKTESIQKSENSCNYILNIKFFDKLIAALLTVSAAVRLIPSPPALVLSRKTKMSERAWKSATMSRRSEILEDPSSLMYVCFLCHMYSYNTSHLLEIQLCTTHSDLKDSYEIQNTIENLLNWNLIIYPHQTYKKHTVEKFNCNFCSLSHVIKY